MPTSTKVWINLAWYGAVLLFVIAYNLWVRIGDAKSERQAEFKRSYRLRIQEANDRSRRPIDVSPQIVESVEQMALSDVEHQASEEVSDSRSPESAASRLHGPNKPSR